MLAAQNQSEQDKGWTVGGVVVIYFPEQEVLDRLLRALAPQVVCMVVIDNGALESTRAFLRGLATEMPSLEILLQRENVGVAAAHNIGINRLQTRGCTHVLLLDQDSIPAPDMVDKLLQACLQLELEGKRVAAVGPGYQDPVTGHGSFFVRFGWLRFKRIYSDRLDNTPISVDFLISSGALIPIATLEQVGGMDEGLFIDHVDTEWFLRAASLGYRAYGMGTARMEHSLGKGAAIRLWLGRWRHVAIHSPLRHYYMFRNSILIYRKSHASWKWILTDSIRLFSTFFFFLAVSPDRFEQGRMMLKGVWDGIRKNTTPLGSA